MDTQCCSKSSSSKYIMVVTSIEVLSFVHESYEDAVWMSEWNGVALNSRSLVPNLRVAAELECEIQMNGLIIFPEIRSSNSLAEGWICWFSQL
ncbi:unnamed protein product [Calypogeia fissa]